MRWKYQGTGNQYRTWAIPKLPTTPMLMSLMIWLCALPVLALVAAPLLGWQIAIYLAGFLLVADIVACWFLCRVRLPKTPAICTKCLKRLEGLNYVTRSRAG